MFRLVVWSALIVWTIGLVAGYSVKQDQAYHDKIYQQCVADGQRAYYCDALAWQATHSKFGD
jgi:hypothetical protein